MGMEHYTPNFIGHDFIGISLNFTSEKIFHCYNTEYFIKQLHPDYIAAEGLQWNILQLTVMKAVVQMIFSLIKAIRCRLSSK